MSDDSRPTPPFKGRDPREEEIIRDIYARLLTPEEIAEIVRSVLREEGLI